MGGLKSSAVRWLFSAALALSALVGQGTSAAFATLYNFTFTDGTVSIIGTLTTGAGSAPYIVTGITGTVSGESGANSANGAITGLITAPNYCTYGFCIDNKLFYPSGSGSNPTCPACYVDTYGIGFTVGAQQEAIFVGTNSTTNYQATAGGNNYNGAPGGPGSPFTSAAGTLTVTAASPAPIPGAGTLSWLALALGVVIVRRKAISAALRAAYSRIAARESFSRESEDGGR